MVGPGQGSDLAPNARNMSRRMHPRNRIRPARWTLGCLGAQEIKRVRPCAIDRQFVPIPPQMGILPFEDYFGG